MIGIGVVLQTVFKKFSFSLSHSRRPRDGMEFRYRAHTTIHSDDILDHCESAHRTIEILSIELSSRIFTTSSKGSEAERLSLQVGRLLVLMRGQKEDVLPFECLVATC